MSNPLALDGLHHVTAIAGDPRRNLHFYRDVLGLRMVKQTVNFDDPFTYHFYFADAVGTPGTVLTFFPWSDVRPGRAGTGSVETVGFRVRVASLGFWRDRLTGAGVTCAELPTRFGEHGLTFPDPDGLRIELLACDRPDTGVDPWASDSVPSQHALRGMLRVTARMHAVEPTEALLVGTLGFRRVAKDGDVIRFASGAADGANFYDVLVDPGSPPALSGRGSVHHVAWCSPDLRASQVWRTTLLEAGRQVSPVMDRLYFQSIYFREPGGVLFEIATRGPGFDVDEPRAELGASLRLPPMHEPRRAEIVAALPTLEA